MRKILLAFASLCLTQACSQEPSSSSETGEVRIPLVANTLNRAFQLQNGNFRITGDTTQNINPPADAASVQVNLNQGAYAIEVLGGWQLLEVVNGNAIQRDATLVSQNPQPFTIVLQETTDIQFSFDTTGTVIPFGLGALSVGVNVITDESLCPTVYADADGDGYGDPATAQQLCDAGVGYVSNGEDCYDANSSVFPGQLVYSSAHRGDGSFDFNCDGVDTQQPNQIGPSNCEDKTRTCTYDAETSVCTATCSSSCGSACTTYTMPPCGQKISFNAASCATISAVNSCTGIGAGGPTATSQACR